ncbi:unnamed protein product [Lactuca saligna]|uniref:Uncharacterized protein n=1 Tax=Lactuca saligna TaxID=75948 RepID=A0AA35YV83_LACSI|nr:unnamed protein product [Lactuca saligna]
MADDLCYAAIQTSTLMVETADSVHLPGASQWKLKVLQGALAGMREEVHDLEAERQKGVVRVIDRVIESAEFAKGVQDAREACEVLGFEKGRQMSGCSTSSSNYEVSGPG